MKDIVLDITSKAIKEEFTRENTIDKQTILEKNPFLNEEQASFVTLTINNNLRGCIGSIIPHRALIDDIIHNAKAAAFSDPRFPPLSEEEFQNTQIEVSLLTVPQELEYIDTNDLKSKIRPKIDGVILSKNGYQATFLPQVWEDLKDFNSFFTHLCNKAGLYTNCLEQHPEIFTYQVEKFK